MVWSGISTPGLSIRWVLAGVFLHSLQMPCHTQADTFIIEPLLHERAQFCQLTISLWEQIRPGIDQLTNRLYRFCAQQLRTGNVVNASDFQSAIRCHGPRARHPPARQERDYLRYCAAAFKRVYPTLAQTLVTRATGPARPHSREHSTCTSTAASSSSPAPSATSAPPPPTGECLQPRLSLPAAQGEQSCLRRPACSE